MDEDKDKALFAYLLSQGQLTPEQEQMLRQQESINTLRERSMEAPETKMYGRVAVAPSWAQALGNVAQGVSAGYQQKGLDAQRKTMSDTQGTNLGKLMDRMFPGQKQAAPVGDPEQAQRQRNAQQYGVPLTDEEIRRRQMGMDSL